jgi:hypothetical protein
MLIFAPFTKSTHAGDVTCVHQTAYYTSESDEWISIKFGFGGPRLKASNNTHTSMYIMWRIDPLLGKDLETNNEYNKRRINKRPFLSNGWVNKFPRKREAHNITYTMETGVFSMWVAPMS